MKTVMIKFWSLVIKFVKWYLTTNRWNMVNGMCWTMGIFVFVGALIYYLDFGLEGVLTRIAMVPFLGMILILVFFVEDNWVRRLTHDKLKTPIELLKKFSNLSYVYGLLFWSFSGEIIIYVMICFLFGIVVSIIEFTIINVMGFTFLWFTYHLYINNELGSDENKQAVIKLKLQLFAAVASSVSALLLLFDSWREFKVMVTMLALVFTWLRYIIDAESQNKRLAENSKNSEEKIVD